MTCLAEREAFTSTIAQSWKGRLTTQASLRKRKKLLELVSCWNMASGADQRNERKEFLRRTWTTLKPRNRRHSRHCLLVGSAPWQTSSARTNARRSCLACVDAAIGAPSWPSFASSEGPASSAGVGIGPCLGSRTLFSSENGWPYLWTVVSGTAVRVMPQSLRQTALSGGRSWPGTRPATAS